LEQQPRQPAVIAVFGELLEVCDNGPGLERCRSRCELNEQRLGAEGGEAACPTHEIEVPSGEQHRARLQVLRRDVPKPK